MNNLISPLENTSGIERGAERPWRRSTWVWLLSILTVATILVHGFHPLAEDGGLYAAGIYLKLHPGIFPRTFPFVRGPMHYSQFAWLLSAFVRAAHIPVLWGLFVADCGTAWLTLFAARQVLRRCVPSDAAQLGGAGLLAAWWTLPIAGTSLLLMDPYVTARSFSTPLSLLAIAYALDPWQHAQRGKSTFRRLKHPAVLCVVYLGIAALLHPLMAAYAFGLVVVLQISRLRKQTLALICFCAFVFAFCSVLQYLAPTESQAWLTAEITRYYWFLSQWHWFEVMGLVGPLAVLGLIFVRLPSAWTAGAGALCRSCIATGLIAGMTALLFAKESASSHAVARLQPLRCYLLIYALMAMLLGARGVHAALATAGRQRKQWMGTAVKGLAAACIAGLACIMGSIQCELFPASPHMEYPWRADRNRNPWVQAFLWAGQHTPQDALFALDAHYITTPGEDAQTFRATALRDALPDYSKDGGEAAITPGLAERWRNGSNVQQDLDTALPGAKKKLQDLGVTWVILRSASQTASQCPYDNGEIKVCRFKTN